MRRRHTAISLFLFAALGAALPACTSGPHASKQNKTGHHPGPVANTVNAPAPISLEGWQAETFPLPPAFAPDLPSGTESLRFPPGWRDPATENFWSYAFVIWINEPAPDAARIATMLEKYYNGLMASFAADKAKDISATPARIDITRTAPNHFEARMHLIDAFATFKPIGIRIAIDTAAKTDTRSTLRIRVSPQPKEHPLWQSLDAATASILSQERAPHAKPVDKAAEPVSTSH